MYNKNCCSLIIKHEHLSFMCFIYVIFFFKKLINICDTDRCRYNVVTYNTFKMREGAIEIWGLAPNYVLYLS